MESLDTTEFVSLFEETTNGPNLPEHIWGHCFVQLNENEFMMAGGVSKESYATAKSWIFNRLEQKWTPGPDMSARRYLHQCGTFISDAHEGRMVVVASGGYTFEDGMVATAEIYDHMDPTKGWQATSDMPAELAEFSMITSPSGKGVIASGGISGSDRQTGIHEMTCTQSGCEWKTLQQKLEFERMNHVSMLIPDDMTTCN